MEIFLKILGLVGMALCFFCTIFAYNGFARFARGQYEEFLGPAIGIAGAVAGAIISALLALPWYIAENGIVVGIVLLIGSIDAMMISCYLHWMIFGRWRPRWIPSTSEEEFVVN